VSLRHFTRHSPTSNLAIHPPATSPFTHQQPRHSPTNADPLSRSSSSQLHQINFTNFTQDTFHNLPHTTQPSFRQIPSRISTSTIAKLTSSTQQLDFLLIEEKSVRSVRSGA
jgi:hypothetical protein